MKISIEQTPIQQLSEHMYIKRDDLIGFSFGGNKVRIAVAFMEDMKQKQGNCMVAYGSRRSNLCRVMANLCACEGIPCHVITSVEEDHEEDTFNSRFVKDFGAQIHLCIKSEVSKTVETLMQKLAAQGLRPYYIYGNSQGLGNETTASRAYKQAYTEILSFEASQKISFDYIFLASGTGMTQGGLIAGQQQYGGNARIVGISIARDSISGTASVRRFAGPSDAPIDFLDDYLCGGYGRYNNQIKETTQMLMRCYGIPLDTTYTGKAYYGMLHWLEQEGITHNNVLFLHTGGIPLCFEP